MARRLFHIGRMTHSNPMIPVWTERQDGNEAEHSRPPQSPAIRNGDGRGEFDGYGDGQQIGSGDGAGAGDGFNYGYGVP